MLDKIQAELKAPKGQFNTFGKYHYRSCEDIVEAVKPILAKYECYLLLSDEIIEVGGRVYVKSTATIKGKSIDISVSAFAREPAEKKGADHSQITGSASSYARKYALNGLLAIDDTKDADSGGGHQSVFETLKTRLKAVKNNAELDKVRESMNAQKSELTSDQSIELRKILGTVMKSLGYENE